MDIFLKICHNYYETFSSFWENMSEWQWDIFLLFSKIGQNDYGTFSSCFESLSEWPMDICLLFLKTCQNDHWTFYSFFWKFGRMTMGHFTPFLFHKGCKNFPIMTYTVRKARNCQTEWPNFVKKGLKRGLWKSESHESWF